VDEDSAAAPGDAWSGIVVDLDDKIVEPIGAPEPVAWFTGRPAEWPVVPPIGWVFTPSIIRSDAPDGKQGARPRQAISPPPQANRVKLPRRCRTIAFAFVCFDACPAQSRSNRALPGHEPSLRAQPGAHVHMNCG
jgi:hypothetical protein